MSTNLYTSLAEIKSFNPCVSGWKNILKGQGKKEADNILFPLTDCLESNSINDVCWLLGKRKKEIDIAVKFAKKCADSVSHIKNVDASYASYATYAASEAASASAAYAAASVDASYDASYASYAASTAANAASASAAYTTASAYAAAASAAYDKQIKLNKQFLIECIKEWEESH